MPSLQRLNASHEYGNLIGAGRILPHGWKSGHELPDGIFQRARTRQGKSVDYLTQTQTGFSMQNLCFDDTEKV